MASKKIYKHHQRTTIALAQADAQPREIVLGAAERQVSATFEDGLQIILNPYFNITGFGAVGDGVTNNTTFINNALSAASTAGGGNVVVPAGNFKVLGTLNIPIGVNLIGYGEYAVSRIFGDGTNTLVEFSGTTWHQHSVISDLNLDLADVCINATPSSTNGASFCTLKRVRIARFTTYGIKFGAGNTNPEPGNTFSGYNLISNVTFAGTLGGTNGTGVGLYVQGVVTTLTVRDSWFMNMKHAVHLAGGQSQDTINFDTCSFEDCSHGHVLINNSSGFGYAASSLIYWTARFMNCRFETQGQGSNFGACISAINGSKISVIDCKFYTNTFVTERGTIEVDGEDHEIILNKIWNAASLALTSYGIWLKSNTKRCKVWGNTFPSGVQTPSTQIQDDSGANQIYAEIFNNLPASGGNVFAGEIFRASSYATNNSILQICYVAGTQGTLAGCTFSGTSGAFSGTVNSASNLYVNNYITIVGNTGSFRITEITGTTIDFTPALNATVTTAAVAYLAPEMHDAPAMFTRGGIICMKLGATNVIGYSSVAPSSGTWNAGDTLLNDSPTVPPTNTRLQGLLQCTVSGTPGTWVQKGFGQDLPNVLNLRGADAATKEIVGYIGSNAGWEFYLGDTTAKSGDASTGTGGGLAKLVGRDNAGNNPITVFDAYRNGDIAFGGRIRGKKGADVASANDTTLSSGNYFKITGSTTINGIAVVDWTAGSVVILEFGASVTVKHNTAASGGFASLKLAGAVDFSATADDTLTLVYDGTTWRETARAVI